jgi:hypothetical protein
MATEPAAPGVDRYRQGIPTIGLYIERATERVPNDGRYHVLHDGALVGSYRGLKGAQLCYRRRLEESGYKPAVAKTPSAEEQLRHENIERDLLRSASFWAESYRHGAGGGRLRHR